MRKKTFWIVWLLTLVVFIPVGWVKAQEPEQTQEAGAVQTGGQFTFDLSWLDLGFEERVLQGASETAFDIYLPNDIIPVPTGNYLNLVFSHSTPQTDQQADLSVTFNRTLLQLVPLTVENAERASLRFDLPGDLLQPGRNRLEVALNTGDVCGEEGLTSNVILALHDDSLSHLEYDLATPEPDLSIYPLPFYEATFLPGQVYFVLPEEPTATDISVAASISAGLGIYSQGRARVASVVESELTDEIRQNNHLIVIGQPEANDLLAQLPLPLALNSPLIEGDNGVLQELVSPWNPNKIVLVLTGQTEAGLLKAGDVLNRDLNFLGLKGQLAVVSEVLPPSQSSGQRVIDVTFDTLGYEDVTFYGARPQEQSFDFWMPRSWQMPEDAKLYISFNHATVIDPLTSTLNVELNNTPVASTLLNAQNAINGVLETDLPAWLLKPGRNTVRVKVQMVMGEDPCLNRYNEQAWTVVRRDSFVHLPFIEQDADLDLSLFPYPFTIDSNLTNVSLVLPDVLSRLERDRLLQLAVRLGEQANGDRITLRAVWAKDVNDSLKESNHLIVIGRPTNNSLLRELNEYLPQPFEQDTDQLVPKLDSAILVETNIRPAGLLQELSSPWNPARSILVITGTTDPGVAAAFDWLLDDLPEEFITARPAGDLAVIEDERTYSTDTRLLGEQSSTQEEARVKPVVQPGTAPQRELVNRWW